MAKSGRYTKYTDDRDPSITAMIADDDSEAKKHWHEESYTFSNGGSKPYLFSDENDAEFIALRQKQDREFNEWLAGGAS